MSNFKFSPDLFLEVFELERFRDFLDKDGFRKNILENTVQFGLIKNKRELAFKNGRVQGEVDLTLKVEEIKAIDKQGRYIYSPGVSSLSIAQSDKWYWVKVSYQSSSKEKGKISISRDGDVVGTDTEFTKILRGMPNFPSRIRFPNSLSNTSEYDVIEVLSDTQAILAYPNAENESSSVFNAESGLAYEVVGTFTPGVSIPSENKFPFEYDSAKIEVVEELVPNTRPSAMREREFYLARVKIENSEIIVQDKRSEFWETKGSSQNIEISSEQNPVIGVESIKWQNLLSPASENEVYVAWGMRSKNWAVDSSKNILTLFGSSLGGRFKSVEDFTNGDFDGWRVYTENGNYSYIVSSIKQGQAINLTLDVLDVDNYSSDGGITFKSNSEWVLVVPDCEEVEIEFKPLNQTISNVDRSFTFPVNTLIARCDLEVYDDPSCSYEAKYRYKTNKIYTGFRNFLTNTAGYYTEESFDGNGELKIEGDRVASTSNNIVLQLSPNSYSRFVSKVYLGDKPGINTIMGLLPETSVIDLVVGRDKKCQYFAGTFSLTTNLYINLSKTGAVEGNTFRIHIKAAGLELNGNKILISTDHNTGTPKILKEIKEEDIQEMRVRDDGIIVDAFFSEGDWRGLAQNYKSLSAIQAYYEDPKRYYLTITQLDREHVRLEGIIMLTEGGIETDTDPIHNTTSGSVVIGDLPGKFRNNTHYTIGFLTSRVNDEGDRARISPNGRVKFETRIVDNDRKLRITLIHKDGYEVPVVVYGEIPINHTFRIQQ